MHDERAQNPQRARRLAQIVGDGREILRQNQGLSGVRNRLDAPVGAHMRPVGRVSHRTPDHAIVLRHQQRQTARRNFVIVGGHRLK